MTFDRAESIRRLADETFDVLVVGGGPAGSAAALRAQQPFAAATQAVYETLKALREGTLPKNLKGLASAELTGRAMREADVKARATDWLGLKK